MQTYFLSKFIRNLFWIIPFSFIIGLWEYTSPILIQLIFAYICMILINPVVNWLESKIKKRTLSVLIVISFLLILFISLARFIFPILSNQIIGIQSILNMETFTSFIEKLEVIANSILPNYIFLKLQILTNSIDYVLSDLWSIFISDIQGMINGAGNVVIKIGSLFVSIIFIFVFLIFLLLDGNNFKRSFINAIPNQYFEMTLNIFDKINDSISSYIRAQLLAGLSVAITSIIGLYLLQWFTGIHIPYTYLIGCIAGLSNLIPFIGPIIGTLITIIIYLVSDQLVQIQFIYILGILSVFAIVQLIDNIIVSPLIMSESVGIHPMFVIIIVLVGGGVGGVLGMLLSIPISAIVKVIITELKWGFEKYKLL